MQLDRRAWWMRHWLLGTTCIQTIEVFATQHYEHHRRQLTLS